MCLFKLNFSRLLLVGGYKANIGRNKAALEYSRSKAIWMEVARLPCSYIYDMVAFGKKVTLKLMGITSPTNF